MATDIRVTEGTDSRTPGGRPSPATPPPADPDASLGSLVRQLADDSSILIRQEMALAKAEMQANIRKLGKDAAVLAAGGAVLLVGVLVLTAFLVALLGDVLGDEYWLGALIVGVVYALIGGAMLMKGKSGLQHDDLKPEQALETLREDKRWAQQEARQVKRDFS